jgi:hypothetical protein
LATVRIEADEIRRQMAEIRSQLHEDVREVVNVATSATDWRSYIRGHAWLAIGVAFASGYLLVPRRSRPTTVVVQPPEVDMRNLQAAEKAQKPRRLPLLRWLLGAIGPIAVRAAQSYALNHVENLLANQQTGPPPEAVSRRSSPAQTSRPEGRGFAARGGPL